MKAGGEWVRGQSCALMAESNYESQQLDYKVTLKMEQALGAVSLIFMCSIYGEGLWRCERP